MRLFFVIAISAGAVAAQRTSAETTLALQAVFRVRCTWPVSGSECNRLPSLMQGLVDAGTGLQR